MRLDARYVTVIQLSDSRPGVWESNRNRNEMDRSLLEGETSSVTGEGDSLLFPLAEENEGVVVPG